MAGLDFQAMSGMTNQSSAATRERMGLEQANADAARQAVAGAVGSVATSTSKAFMNYVLSKGSAALEMGLDELRREGQIDPAMEQAFRSIDTSNREEVMKALQQMAAMRDAFRADKKAREFAQSSGEDYIAEQEKLIEMGKDARGIPYTEPMKQMLRKKAREEAMSRTRSMAKFKLENPAYGAFKERFGEDPKDLGQQAPRVDYMTRRDIIKDLKMGGIDMLPSLDLMAKEFNGTMARHTRDIWGIAASSDAVRRAGNVINKLGEMLAHESKYNDGMIGKVAEVLHDKFFSQDAKTLGLTEEERDDLNVMMGSIGNVMAQYIKLMSGLSVTEGERRFLMSNLNMANFSSAEAFARSMNNLIQDIAGRAMKAEKSAEARNPEVYEDVLMTYGGPPSEQIGSIQIVVPQFSKGAAPRAAAPSTTPASAAAAASTSKLPRSVKGR